MVTPQSQGICPLFTEDMTDDLASECIEKGLLDELIALCQDDTLITKVAQVLAEVAKTGETDPAHTLEVPQKVFLRYNEKYKKQKT